MPELPEVETIVRALRHGGRDGPSLIGRTFATAEIFWARSLAEPGVQELQARLPGQTVLGLGRRGKFAMLRLTRDTLMFHLRMSGDLRVEPAFSDTGQPLPPHTHDRAVFTFVDGFRLAFKDTRKFGRIWLLADPETVVAKLGPEPLDLSLTPADFYASLQLRSRQLKPLLLDQTFLAGLGNIYTDEALHLARLHPLRSSDSLDEEDALRLLSAIRTVLTLGIRNNGASIDWVYRGGEFQNVFRVYGRTGQPCPVCGTPIQHSTVGAAQHALLPGLPATGLIEIGGPNNG